MKTASTSQETNGSQPAAPVAKLARPAKLPRQLASSALKKKNKLAVVFQGGSAMQRMQTANLLANHLALKVYRVDIRPFISRFIGETEKNLDRIFNNVHPEDTLLYFDEVDMLFGKEKEKNGNGKNGKTSRNGGASARRAKHEKDWISYFNKRLADFPGKVLVATNSHARTNQLSGRLKPVVAHLS